MRFRFALLVTALLAAACAPADAPDTREARDAAGGDQASAQPSGAYDLLIAGGTVVDGTGAPARRADVLVREGRIAYVGELGSDARAGIDAAETFDASGLTITPGFIDAHAHGSPAEDPTLPNFLAMGVTTIVLGQDGGSPPAAEMADAMNAIDAAHPAVNVAFLVGHGTIRRESGVEYGEADSEGLVRMSELVGQALEAGAFGLSTGLEYNPGFRADDAELAAIADPVAAAGGVVVSHMRSEDADKVSDALAELIRQGRASGARVHASHLKIVLGKDSSQAASLLGEMAAARAEGVDVTADVYPYTASYTGIGILFPEWAEPPADYEQVVAERRDELAEHLRMRVESRNGPGATLFGPGDYAGRTLEQVAADEGRAYEDVLIDLGPGGASAAYFVMDEHVMADLLADPHVVVSSDGSPTMRHPRGYGSFPLVIRRYVEEEGRLSIEDAVRKMSGLTAEIYRLDDPDLVDVPRGQVRAGWAADLLAFDPAEVRDEADFENPHQLATGMRAVWVGGSLALRDGTPVGDAGAGNGTVLRAQR